MTRVGFAVVIQEASPYAHRQFSDSTIGALRMRKNGDDYKCLKRHAKLPIMPCSRHGRSLRLECVRKMLQPLFANPLKIRMQKLSFILSEFRRTGPFHTIKPAKRS